VIRAVISPAIERLPGFFVFSLNVRVGGSGFWDGHCYCDSPEINGCGNWMFKWCIYAV
jgi:hypothetical protein